LTIYLINIFYITDTLAQHQINISECFKNVTLATNSVAPWRWS